jgi:hypothetical protein
VPFDAFLLHRTFDLDRDQRHDESPWLRASPYTVVRVVGADRIGQLPYV